MNRMKTLYSLTVMGIVLFAMMTLSSCGSDDPEISTGSARVRFRYNSQQPVGYFLFTENIWSAGRTASPIRTGTLPVTDDLTETEVTFNGLLPGNYVFSTGVTNAHTIQIVGGTTTSYEF